MIRPAAGVRRRRNRLVVFTTLIAALIAGMLPAAPASAAITNPGSVRWRVTTGRLALRSITIPLSNAAYVDTTVDADGTISAAAGDVVFPDVAVSVPGLGSVNATLIPTGNVTGNVDPSTGAMRLKLGLTAIVHQAILGDNCTIGPIDTTLYSGTDGSATGVGYGRGSAGAATLVSASFAVPAASGCGAFGLLDGTVNTAIGLPLAAGKADVRISLSSTPELSGSASVPGGGNGPGTGTPPPPPPPVTLPAAPRRAFGSVAQASATGLDSGASAELLNTAGSVVASGTVDSLGSVLYRDIPAGAGYRVRSSGWTSDPVTVLAPDTNPPASFYSSLPVTPGYGYLTMRDGVTLSATIRLPDPAVWGPGPYPVLVNYSGYAPSDPGNAPAELLLAGLDGYATVGVNMRGTGCSGGAFDYFEYLQSLDGYDVIEQIAAQPWAGKVGLIGLSWPGISQLFVARTQPPHLAAIAPQSVIADSYRSVLYPGGILNDGFGIGWASEREAQARPAASGWSQTRITGGDTVCGINQRLRLQAVPILAQLLSDLPYDARAASRAPRTFADRINVPTFLSGAWNDEQTGSDFATMLDHLAPGTLHKFNLTNGMHVEGFGPAIAGRLLEFFDFTVAGRVPHVPDELRASSGSVYEQIFGIKGLAIPADRFAGMDFASAYAQWAAEPPVRVLWENGTGGVTDGAPLPGATSTYAAWPPASTVAEHFWLDADGRLADAAPTTPDGSARGRDAYQHTAASQPKDFFPSGGNDIWKTKPNYVWKPSASGQALSYTSDAIATTQRLAGSGSVDVWARVLAPAADLDLEAELTEVRPDNTEVHVQSGWLRASSRATDATASTPLRPFHTFTAADRQPVPVGTWMPMRIEIPPFGHVLRAGSRLRLTIDAPGGNRPIWMFSTAQPASPVPVEIAHDASHPSQIVLPRLDDGDAAIAAAHGATPPACGALRGQPCRALLAGARPGDTPSDVTAQTAGAGRIGLTWQAPAAGSGATGQRVVAEPTGETFDVAADATSFTYARATPGISYRFRVAALAAGGAVRSVSSASLDTTVSAARSDVGATGFDLDVSGHRAYAPARTETAGGPSIPADAWSATAVSGRSTIPGADGRLATIDWDLRRVWILPIMAGSVTVTDPTLNRPVRLQVFAPFHIEGSNTTVADAFAFDPDATLPTWPFGRFSFRLQPPGA